MSDDNRVDRLRAEIDELKIRTDRGGLERALLALGATLMLVGVVLAFAGYFIAANQNSGNTAIDNLEHNESIILALAGVATTILGAALFLRYSLASFLRFWLLRQLYEGQANTAELVARLRDD